MRQDNQAPQAAWKRAIAMFSQPAFSVAFVAFCMLLGLFLAEVRLTRAQEERGVQIAGDYIRLVDPLTNQGPR